jgi:hypothetical protein
VATKGAILAAEAIQSEVELVKRIEAKKAKEQEEEESRRSEAEGKKSTP